MTGVFIKRENLDTETHIEGRQYEDTGGKTTIYHQREKPGTDPSLTAVRRNQPCQHLDLRLLASRTVRQ